MKRRSSKQLTEKKPLLANNQMWREIPESLQGKVVGGETNPTTDVTRSQDQTEVA